MKKWAGWLLWMLLGTSVLIACSSSSKGNEDSDGGSAGRASGGSAGSGATGGAGGSGGSGGDAGSGARVHPTTGQTWTILVYMLADNDLEPFALKDILEMMKVGSSSSVTILAQVDRAQGYTNSAIGGLADWTTSLRVKVNKDSLTKIADLGEQNLGDPAVLSDFIKWGMTTAPADRYGLVLWDHGGAWPVFGADESANYDGLTLAELKQGISSAFAGASNEQFSFIGFDACLMATYETALSLSPFAEYLLASEELEPGHGWDYDSLALLTTAPTTGPLELGKAMIQGFRAQAESLGTDEKITLSLTDLYALDGLSKAVGTLASALGGANVASLAPAVGSEREATLRFGDSPDPTRATNMVDLGQLSTNLNSDPAVTDANVKSASLAVSTALNQIIVGKTAGAIQAKSRGLSIYFPPAEKYYDTRYDTLPEVATWRTFLKAYYQAAGSLQTHPHFTDANHIATVQSSGSELLVSGHLAAGTAASVTEATLSFGIQDTGLVILLGDQPADVNTTNGVVSTAWDTMILSLKQGTKTDFGYFSLTAAGGGFASVAVPLEYQETPSADADYVELVLVLDSQGNEVSRTFYKRTDSGAWSELVPVSGSIAQPLVYVVPETGTPGWSLTGTDTTFDPTQAIELSLAPLPSGQNITAFMELDVRDFSDESDYVFATQLL